MKRLSIFGSTGSIGQSTLRVVDHLEGQFTVISLACQKNITLLEKQIRRYKPRFVAVEDRKGAKEIRSLFPDLVVLEGKEGVNELASLDEVESVVMAIVGLDALLPTLVAIKAGKEIALANKEVLVSAGELVMSEAKKKGVKIIPLDSEHSALFQLLENHYKQEVSRLILTASGGPFRKHSLEALKGVSVEEALKHPTWKMGQKVTIDSSTLMNKGFEVIEAKWLFDIPIEQIEVVIHPQSLVHSFIETIDSTLFAHLHAPDMAHPIQYALTYPRRVPSLVKPFDFTKHGTLEFFSPDVERFPCLDLAFQSVKEGGSLSCYLNAANEVLVHRLLKKELSWWEMTQKLTKLMERHQKQPLLTLESVLNVDANGRAEAKSI
jgi:1-deoxy-D-xylulose-5-phosphate reductoisomerase